MDVSIGNSTHKDRGTGDATDARRPKSGPNKSDILSAIAKLKISVEHRKALLVLAAQCIERHRSAVYSGHLIERLLVRENEARQFDFPRHCDVPLATVLSARNIRQQQGIMCKFCMCVVFCSCR